MKEIDDIGRVEKEIDESFAASRLVNFGFAQAVWTLLSMNEDVFFKYIQVAPAEQLPAFTDNRMNALTHPLRVCFERCEKDNSVVCNQMIDEHYRLAWEWLEAADDYGQFCSIFPLWHRGKIGLSIASGTLVVDRPLDDMKEYEAYNRLIQKEARQQPTVSSPGLHPVPKTPSLV